MWHFNVTCLSVECSIEQRVSVLSLALGKPAKFVAEL
jgi:hypothetical protein